MYAQVASFYPAAGKLGELRAILEEQVRERHGRGLRANLSMTAWGADFPALHITIQYADMAALEKGRAEIATSTQQYQARQAPHLRRTGDLALYELVVPTNLGAAQANFTQHATSTAAVGKGPALRALLTDWVKSAQATGRASLRQQVAGPASGSLTVIRPVENLSELEALRASTQTDPARQAHFAKRDALLAKPVEVSIREILIQFPPA